MASELSEEDLRGFYLDWCSTQVARRFLELSGDEIWLRSHSALSAASAAIPPASPSPSVGAVSRIPDYLEIVRKTALSLAEDLNLPSFTEWKERYLSDPSEFRPDILNHPARPSAPDPV